MLRIKHPLELNILEFSLHRPFSSVDMIVIELVKWAIQVSGHF